MIAYTSQYQLWWQATLVQCLKLPFDHIVVLEMSIMQ